MSHICRRPRYWDDVAQSSPESRDREASVLHEEIARLAYSYWEARGQADGSALEDWLRAERELCALRNGGQWLARRDALRRSEKAH